MKKTTWKTKISSQTSSKIFDSLNLNQLIIKIHYHFFVLKFCNLNNVL